MWWSVSVCTYICMQMTAKSTPVWPSVIITSAVHRLAACIAYVNNWMSASRLRFSPSKTEIMWLGAGHLLQQVDSSDIPVLRVVQ